MSIEGLKNNTAININGYRLLDDTNDPDIIVETYLSDDTVNELIDTAALCLKAWGLPCDSLSEDAGRIRNIS